MKQSNLLLLNGASSRRFPEPKHIHCYDG